MAADIELRRLVIKAFHMTDVEMGNENKITTDGHMTICKDGLEELAAKYSEVIEKIDIEVIDPGDHDRYTNTIMDIIPISVKVLGKCGEGITHTITGVYVMPTGVDTEGEQAHEFGSSEGNLKDMLYLKRILCLDVHVVDVVGRHADILFNITCDAGQHMFDIHFGKSIEPEPANCCLCVVF